MKSFKQFLEEAYNKVINLKDAGWGRPHKQYTKDGKTRYGPTGNRLFRLQAKQSKDDKINGQYKDINNPKKPSEIDLIKGTIPVKKA